MRVPNWILILLLFIVTIAFIATGIFYYFSKVNTSNPVTNKVEFELAKARGDLEEDNVNFRKAGSLNFLTAGSLIRYIRGVVVSIEQNCILITETAGERCSTLPEINGYIVSLDLPENSPHHALFDKLVLDGKLSKTKNGDLVHYEDITTKKLTKDDFVPLVSKGDIVEVAYEIKTQKTGYYALLKKS